MWPINPKTETAKTAIVLTSKKTKESIPVTLKLFLAALILSLSPVAAHAADTPFTDAQKKELETAIHDYLMKNPKVIMDSVDQYRQSQQADEEKGFDAKVKEKNAELYKNPKDPVAGNKDGDVTLVEFFDYNCGYCKHAFNDVQTLIKEDGKLRVVFKDIPILSESSFTAARYALAAGRQNKYWEFHQAMMQHNGGISEESLQSIGKDIGLDVEKMKKDAQDPEIRAQIESNLALARDIGISGTPGFVINDAVLRGAYGIDAMRKTVADARAKK
jgi:protein-disulfide isomerase